MNVIDGKKLSEQILDQIKHKVNQLNIKPGLAVILVGSDSASEIYVKRKSAACEKVGYKMEKIKLPENVTLNEVITNIHRLNIRNDIQGILVQFPLPPTLEKYQKDIIVSINPKKDVDGFHPINVGELTNCRSVDCEENIIPCTPKGIMRLIESTDIVIDGKKAVVIGRSNLAGKPTALLLLAKNATVTICHSATKDLEAITKEADILVVAVGKANFIKGSMVKSGAIVIDVGINRLNNNIVGDVEWESVKNVAGFLSPVPGGVGPMTVAMLMENLLKCYQLTNGKSY